MDKSDVEPAPETAYAASSMLAKLADDRDTPVRRVERRHALMIALVAGVVGIIGAVIGSVVQIVGSASAEEAKEERDQRARVYFTFLESVKEFIDLSYEYDIVCIKDESELGVGEFEIDSSPECEKMYMAMEGAAKDYKNARNRIFVYGSDEAEERAVVLARAMYPLAAYLGGVRPGDDPGGSGADSFDVRQYNSAYWKFAEIVCLELPVEPRSSCSVPG